LKFVTLLN